MIITSTCQKALGKCGRQTGWGEIEVQNTSRLPHSWGTTAIVFKEDAT